MTTPVSPSWQPPLAAPERPGLEILDRADVLYRRSMHVAAAAVGGYIVLALAVRLLVPRRLVVAPLGHVVAVGAFAVCITALAIAGWGVAVEVAAWVRRAWARPRSGAGRRWALIKGAAKVLGASGLGTAAYHIARWCCVQFGDVAARRVITIATDLDPINFPHALSALTTLYAAQLAVLIPFVVCMLVFVLVMLGASVLPIAMPFTVPSPRACGRVAGVTAWATAAALASLIPVGLTGAAATRLPPAQVLVLKDFSADASCAARGPGELVAHLTVPAGQVSIATPDAAARGGYRFRRAQCGP